MGSIPLPALAVKPIEQPDVMAQMGNLYRLKAAQQQLQNAPLERQALEQQVQAGGLQVQQQQQALKDQQAMTAAMQTWDGKDLNQLPALVLKHGGSATAVMGLKQKSLEMQKTYSDIAAQDATTGAKRLETMKGQNDIVAGAVGNVMQMPDQQIAQGLVSTAQDLAQRGLIDPQHAQQAAQLAQSGNPAQIRQQLSILQKGYMAQSQQMESALKGAQTTEASSRAHEADVNAQKAQMEMQLGTGPMADSKYRNILMAQQLGRPVSPEDQAFKAAYEKQKTLVPRTNITLQSGLLSEQAKQMAAQNYTQTGQLPAGMRSPAMGAQILNQAASSGPVDVAGNKMQYAAKTKQLEAFTSGNYSQQLNSINTAREHMKTFNQIADALDNGNWQTANKLGNALGMEFGSDKASNFNLVKQAFASEVGRAFAGAGVTEGDRRDVGDKISAASSPAQLRGAAQVADQLLAGKQTALRMTYEQGQKGQPNFGADNGPNTPAPPATGGDFFSQFGGRKHP